MELEEIDPVGLQSLQRFIDLVRSRLPVAAIDLGHQEDAIAVPAAECLAHAYLAQPVVVIPAVVKERDPVFDRGADNAYALRFGKIRASQYEILRDLSPILSRRFARGSGWEQGLLPGSAYGPTPDLYD